MFNSVEAAIAEGNLADFYREDVAFVYVHILNIIVIIIVYTDCTNACAYYLVHFTATCQLKHTYTLLHTHTHIHLCIS